MEPNNQSEVAGSQQKWQLRWGHILLALFIIVLAIIGYIVVHQIRSADKASQQSCLTTNSCSSGPGHTNKASSNSGSKKTPKSSSTTKPQTHTKTNTSSTTS